MAGGRSALIPCKMEAWLFSLHTLGFRTRIAPRGCLSGSPSRSGTSLFHMRAFVEAHDDRPLRLDQQPVPSTMVEYSGPEFVLFFRDSASDNPGAWV